MHLTSALAQLVPLLWCHSVGHSIEKVLLVGFVKANGL